jgi:hypothetical protein
LEEKYPKKIDNMQSRLTESINRHQILIAQFSFFIAIAVVIIYVFGLRNESLLFVVLIFGIYLVFSGRISQLKFMNVEIMIKDIEGKQPELTEIGLSQPAVDPLFLEKEGPVELESKIIPKLIREAKKVKILRLKITENQPTYNKDIAAKYLRYFTHVIFTDDTKIFYGFAMADELLKELETSRGQEFLNDINKRKLHHPIRSDIYIKKGKSRKQVLDKMEELGLTVLPVVSDGLVSGSLNYEGVVDKDSIMWQITTDFYNYAKNPK